MCKIGRIRTSIRRPQQVYAKFATHRVRQRAGVRLRRRSDRRTESQRIALTTCWTSRTCIRGVWWRNCYTRATSTWVTRIGYLYRPNNYIGLLSTGCFKTVLFGIFSLRNFFCVKFCKFAGHSYSDISTNFCRFILIFHDQMALIFIARQHTDARDSKSVCLSVRYFPVPDENGLTYRHSFFHHTVAQSF